MASPDDWNKVGYDGNPVAGNPDVLDDIAVDLHGLERLATDVDVGLDAMLRTSENGGFEGETADALRTYVKDELRTFMLHVRTSFQGAASAAERYAKALRESQGKAEGAARRAGEVAIPPAGIVGKNAPPPPELTAARNDVQAEVDFIDTEAKILEEALDSARDLVTRPVKKIKKSFWKKFQEVFWKTLEILSIVVSIVAVIFGGPLGLVAFGLAAVLFAKAVVDFATGKTNALGLGLAFLGILFPSTKGLTSFTRAMQLLKGGGKMLLAGAQRSASALGRMFLQGGKLLLSPRTFASVVGQNLLSAARWTNTFVVSTLPRATATVWRVAHDVTTSMWRQFSGGLGRDFARTTSFLGGGSRALRLSVFAIIALPRFMANTLLPLRYFEIAKFGWRGAFRMGVLERGLRMRPSTAQSLTRMGGAGGTITSLRGKDPVTFGSGGGLDNVTTPHLVVPGTRAWDEALDGLDEIAARPPVTPTLPSGMSSLPHAPGVRGGMPEGTSGRAPAAPDDLERMALHDLDAAGGRLGNVFQRERLDTLGTFRGGPVPTRLFRNLVDDLDQLGMPLRPGRGPLLLKAPDSAVTRLQELDDVLGLERTATGLLKPFDDVSDLASLSLDGKLGGLSETQLLKVLDGEIDLVNVRPDGVILRIGKTDPVDVHVGLKDEVTIRVLDPQESGAGLPPLLTRMTGPDSPARLGIGLDDLARLIPDSTGGMRQVREVLGMSPARTGLAVKPVTPPQTGFPPLTLREIVTGGAVGKIGADRFETWIRLQNAEVDLDTAGQELTRLTELPDAPPLSRAQAELDLNAAELNLGQVRTDFGRLGMNLDAVRQDITSMMTRFDSPPATLPSTTPVTSALTGDLPVGAVAHGLDGAAGPVDHIRLVDTVKAGFEVKPVSFEVRALGGTNAGLPSTPLNTAGRELPLLGQNLGPLAQVRLVVTTPPPGATLTGKTFELIGASDVTGSLRIAPVEGALAGRLPNGFTLTDLANNRFHFDEGRTLIYRDVPDPAGTGFLRHTEGATPGTEPVQLDAQGRFSSLFRFEAGAGPDPAQAPPHWLVRQDMDFSASTLKSGMKTRLTDDGLVPANLDGTVTPLQAVATANAKAFKQNSPFTAFSPPGSIVKSYGNHEIGLDLIALRTDIAAGGEHLGSVEILSTTKVQKDILDEIRLKTSEPQLDVPSTFNTRTSTKEIQEFLTQNTSVGKSMAAKITADVKALLQVRQDSTWLIKGAIPAKYLTGPYATADSLQFVPTAPTTPLAASTDVLESAGRASGSAAPAESLQLTLKPDDFSMSAVPLDDLRGVKLVRQDDFFTTAVDSKGLRKSYFAPDLGIVPANPEGRTTAFQHVAGAENAARKSNSPFTSFAVVGSHKVYGDMEVTLDVFKLGEDIKAGRVQNVAILPAHDLQRLISDQIEWTIKRRLDLHSALTGDSTRQDVLAFLKQNDVNLVGQGGKDVSAKIASDVRVLLNTTRDQEWLIKGVIPKGYLEGPYPRAGLMPTGTVHGLDEAAGNLRLTEGELPFLGRDLGPLSRVRVVVTDPPPGATLTGRTFQLAGASDLTGSLKIAPVEGTLAGRLPNGFTVTDLANNRFHFDEGRNLVYRDVADPDGTGFLRYAEDAPPGTEPVRLDEQGRFTELFRFEAGAGHAPPPPPMPAPRVPAPPAPHAPPPPSSVVHQASPGVSGIHRAKAPGFEKSFPSSSIGTESELTGFVVALPENSHRTFAHVVRADSGEPLLQVTKDMSQGPYANPAKLVAAQKGNWLTHTVELVSYPSLVSDEVALTARNDATQFLLDVFKERLDGHNHAPLGSLLSADGRFRLEVTNDRHVLAAGTGSRLDEQPLVSMPLSGQQATMGVRATEFGTGATDELRLLEDNAPWYNRGFKDDDALRQVRNRLDNPQDVENAYTYLKSVIDFTSRLAQKHGIPMEGFPGRPSGLALTDPAVKNEWRVLPRTRPTAVLDSLSENDRLLTKQLVREASPIGAELPWREARTYIMNGSQVAGHSIDGATIGGETALLFEFRAIPDKLKAFVPHQNTPVVKVTDLLAEFGNGRSAALQQIKDFVGRTGNKDAFADWYRAEFPQYQAKSTHTIYTMSAANHKAMWIRDHHPQTWQEFTGGRSPVAVDLHASAPTATDLTVLPGSRGPSPVRETPGATVREVPLSGVSDLRGLGLRITEFPASDLGPASVRVEVVDLTAAGGPVRLPDVTVTGREGGGFTVTGSQGGARWQFDSAGHLEFRELPLNGTDFSLRFDMGGSHAMPQVVGTDGAHVPGSTVTAPARDASGALTGLTTVRVPLSGTGTDALHGVFRFDGKGVLRQQELPLTLPGLDGPSGLGVKVTTAPGAGGATTRTFTLTGPPHLTGSFRLAPVDSALTGRIPGGFTVTDTITGSRFHFDTDGRLAFRDLPARDGSGFVRFTGGAESGTPPLRPAEPGGVADGLSGNSPLGGIPDIFRRTLDEATGMLRASDAQATDLPLTRLDDPNGTPVGAEGRPPALGEPTDLGGTGTPRTSSLSDLDDLPELDDEAIRAALQEHWQVVREHWDVVEEHLQPLDDLMSVPLSGVDELAGVELRITHLPDTDTGPGSFRLELADAGPAGGGPGRASEFTIESLDDSGRVAVIDTTGNTRFTFGPDGRFLGRETVLAVDGLPDGLRLGARVGSGPDGAARTMVDLAGPPGSLRSVRLTPVDGALAERLPGGFTLSDTVTDSRFHFDAEGRLVFRDLPSHDGSGFLRHTEGAPGTPPVRLDDVGGAIDLPRVEPDVAPESQILQTLDLSRVPQLTDGSIESLNTFGSSPDLLHGRLHEVTTRAHEGIRQAAADALRDHLNLPPATRLDDLRTGAGHTVGDFTVTPTPHGGSGGSHYIVVHTPSDLVTGFGRNGERLYQEVLLRGGPGDFDGLRLGITGRSAEGGPWTPSSFEFVGTRPADDSLTVTGLAPTAPADLRGGFTVTDASGVTRWHFGPEGMHVLRDVELPGGRGLFRFDAGAPDGVPQVLDTAGRPSTALRVERLDDGRIATIPTGRAAQPLERAVFDAHGHTLLEETLAIRGKGGRPTGEYWNIDHASGKAVRTGADGTPFTGMFDIATVERSGTGQFRLISASPGKATLFEREALANGNTLHVDVSRSGRARWTEFDSAGSRLRHGERIGDVDQRTFHDVPAGSLRLLNNVDVRTYTKALDGGLVRAEKGADGHWTWQRFGKDGTEVLSGDRHWSWNHVAFKDTYRDPVTGLDAVAQRRGQTWPFDGLHGSRMYQEHAVLSGHAPAGGRVDPGDYTGYSPLNVQIERLEAVSGGGSLLVQRFADMRPPAFLWKGAAGRSPFEGFLGDLFGGESLHRVSLWTETAADGTKVTGVRLNPTGSNWVDFDQYGRLVRESRKLENGHVIEVGRSLEDPTRWAPVPEFRDGGSYELHWKDLTSGRTGTRHVDGSGRWRDLFTDSQGIERVQLRSQGKGTREYLFDAPSTEELRLHDDAGLWVDKNSQQHIFGRRDLVDGQIVESSGSPYRTKWTWKSYDPSAPDTLIGEGLRKQNRGSLYSRPWDDSFKDFDLGGNLVRERNATDTGSSWTDAVKADDGSWKWTKRAADGTVHSEGVRVYDDVTAGRWRDLVDGQEVRRPVGDRVREFDYEIVVPEPPTPPAGNLTRGTLRDLLADSARHFEAPATVRVDPNVWKEYDAGKVFRESVAVDGLPGRYRVLDKQWGQWMEFQNGHMVQWQTIDGRVWTTDAFGRLSTSGPARLRQFLAGGLPRVGGDIGLPGSRGWTMIGREFDFRGMDVEVMAHLREMLDVWHGTFTGARGGEVVEMPMWQRELRSGLLTFTTGFVTDYATSLAITAAVQNGDLKRVDYLKALLSGAVGGTFNSGLTLLYNHTRLGRLKTSMGTRDWGGHPNQTLATQTDTWATEFSAQEKATRWRNATYANTVGVGISALSAFVSGSISAAVFGVNGHDTKGLDALVAGGWGALGTLYGGVSTNLVRNGWHATTGARVFHKGGLGEYAMNLGESALSRYFTWVMNEWDDNDHHYDLPNAARSFPPASTAPPPTTPAPPRQQIQQPAFEPPTALDEGLELP
ncbi:actin cross-linking domain-containing toxin [Streptomyces sp. NPDC002888]|uniref:actin cross-linking domain-containing toxin n=1 Tax=Streptomyces sp. NPDC002888 TaxID=3364668 RepID=UPI0036B33277